MNNLPDFKSGFDYSYFASEDEGKWIISEKEEKKKILNSVGEFRNDLKKLRAMRTKKEVKNDTQVRLEIININQETIPTPKSIIIEEDIITKTICTNQPSEKTRPSKKALPTLTFPSSLLTPPSNPLIDQTVKIIKPTQWIDCISRESKRVFATDNWIVARILLPPVSKDSMGLKRVLQ